MSFYAWHNYPTFPACWNVKIARNERSDRQLVVKLMGKSTHIHKNGP